MPSPSHLILYDGECSLCNHAVQFVFKRDRQGVFAFAPLLGLTAKKMLTSLPNEYQQVDSLILIEDYISTNPHFFVLGKATLRICWHLGKVWKLFGCLQWMPSPIYDWVYKLVARNKYRLFSKSNCVLLYPQNNDRFLP